VDVADNALVATNTSQDIIVLQLPPEVAIAVPMAMPMGKPQPTMAMPIMAPVAQPESWLAVAGRGAWTQLDGKLDMVSVGNDGALWGVNSAQAIFRRRVGGGWEAVGGALVQVSCTSYDRAVGVNAGGNIYETQNGRDWRQIPGSAVCVSEGRDGAVFCCNSSGNAFRLNPDRNSWTQLGGAGITQLSVGDAESVIAVAAGLVFRHTPHNNDWARMPGDGGFVRVATTAGARRTVAVAAGGRVLAFDGSSWVPLPSPQAMSVDVADNALVATNTSQDIIVLQLPPV
jgi:hypothetical protein